MSSLPINLSLIPPARCFMHVYMWLKGEHGFSIRPTAPLMLRRLLESSCRMVRAALDGGACAGSGDGVGGGASLPPHPYCITDTSSLPPPTMGLLPSCSLTPVIRMEDMRRPAVEALPARTGRESERASRQRERDRASVPRLHAQLSSSFIYT